MAILVDSAVWRWRGQRWAHMVSDDSLDELHRFAARLGLERRWFQGDHYDVPAHVRERAIALGAEPVRATDLVRRLRAAGLRQRSRISRLPGEPEAGPRTRFPPADATVVPDADDGSE